MKRLDIVPYAMTLTCLYCGRELIAAERERRLCDVCAERILARSYELEEKPVQKHVNGKVLRDLLPWH